MKLAAKQRTIEGKKVKQLRSQDIIPGSVYGPKRKSTNIQVDKKDFIKLFKSVGYNKFFDLDLEGENRSAKVLVKEIQKHPVSDILSTISLYQIDEDTKITVEVPIELIGEAPAVKLNVGFLINQLDQIEVHCFPKDLPSTIQIDISKLENVGDGVTVGDIQLPKDVELSSSMDASSTIVTIAAPQKEEEEAPAEPQLDEEGNLIVAEGAEGEAGEESKEESVDKD